jgi:hypothetical protein
VPAIDCALLLNTLFNFCDEHARLFCVSFRRFCFLHNEPHPQIQNEFALDVSADLDALDTVGQYVRLTKSRKVSVKNCAQIVANMVREHGHAFATDGYALPLDALLPFASLTHRG